MVDAALHGIECVLDLDDLRRPTLWQNDRSTAPITIGRLRKAAERGVNVI